MTIGQLPQTLLHPDYKDMDELIRPLVEAINKLGISTYWSCQGHNYTNIGSHFPVVIITFGKADDTDEIASQKSIMCLLQAIGYANEELNEMASYGMQWILAPDTRVGGGEPFLNLMPNFPHVPLELAQERIPDLVKFLTLAREHNFPENSPEPV
jgi:hypothetical protein